MLIICYLLIFTVCFTSCLIDTLNLIGLFDAHIIYYPCLCLRFNIILAQGADSEILIQLQFICMYEAHLCHWHRQHWNAGCIQMSMYYYIQIRTHSSNMFCSEERRNCYASEWLYYLQCLLICYLCSLFQLCLPIKHNPQNMLSP